uniref:ATP synthase subunit b n=1 Tax=Panagrolaimus sp. JU765 TaxID=591449 RepID=A0AC34Q1I8_9BILA
MALSRVALVPKSGARLVAIIPVRSAHAPAVAETKDDTPGFFQKIALRFKGIPLKDELHGPKSMFDDIGKQFVPPEPLPAVPKDYKEFPERDIVNYPYPARPAFEPKTRLLMFPDSWCTPFHKITGTSGPYLFFGGLFAFMLNKEIWVFEEQGHMLAGWILFYILVKNSFGYRIDQGLYKGYKERMDYFKSLIQEDLKEAVEFHKNSAAETDALAALKENFPVIFKENMALQLEATYRKNVEAVSTELKRRLDYLKETEATKQRFERDYLLKLITQGVQKQVETNEGNIKDVYLDNCISQLKTLSLK